MPGEARRQAANGSPEPLTDKQWQQKSHRLAVLMRGATGSDSLCTLFQLTPGGVMGVVANHPQGDQDPAYRKLKAFLLGLRGMKREYLLSGHCPEAVYDDLNYLCYLAKEYQEKDVLSDSEK